MIEEEKEQPLPVSEEAPNTVDILEEKPIEVLPVEELQSQFPEVPYHGSGFQPMGPFKVDALNPLNLEYPCILLDPKDSLVKTDYNLYTHALLNYYTDS
jgi:hypothetical protein